MKRVPYASAVGSLMYLMICTRPDLAYSVSMVSRFMAHPGKEHWMALKWILRYIKGTMYKGLRYRGDTVDGNVIKGYVDSDYAGSIDTRKSLTGYVFTLNDTAISWKATLQPVVALSSTEAEYMAVTEAFKEEKWMKGFVMELGLKQECLTVYCDNQSAIHLSKHQIKLIEPRKTLVLISVADTFVLVAVYGYYKYSLIILLDRY
ncbi:secreted RxLR effector protein 161-like [Primulina eburnea]|uniref:secreted RxLR effector protein 161-like n=1 Tax=Primulina eburnea TaxID=1245227 RepID=UPI003C6BFB54